jgi:hypothetical protein
MSDLSQLSGVRIKSVQVGSVIVSGGSTSNTATIAAVDTSKSACLFGGSASPEYGVDGGARVTLTNATTVTANRLGSTYNVTAEFTVVEFY